MGERRGAVSDRDGRVLWEVVLIERESLGFRLLRDEASILASRWWY